MTIRVPLRLNRQPGNPAAAALYIPNPGAAELLACCAQIGLDPAGRVFALDGGFLLVLERPATAGCAGGDPPQAA